MIDPCFLSRRFGFLLVSSLFLFKRFSFLAILSSMSSSSSFLNYALFLSLKRYTSKGFFSLIFMIINKTHKMLQEADSILPKTILGNLLVVFEVFIIPLSALVQHKARFIPRWLSIWRNSIHVSYSYGKLHSGPLSYYEYRPCSESASTFKLF
jgi:hypothetical protein